MTLPRLYHVSETPDIARFEPRPHEKHPGKMVWAVDAEHLQNYLLPRQCPRVTFFPSDRSTPEDIEALMGGSSAKHIVAIESRWLTEVLACRLYLYALPPETFTQQDANAGYYISRETVIPLSVTPITNVLEALLAYDIELRLTPSLWKLRERVIASTLEFSIIRMGNAAPPEEESGAYTPVLTPRRIDPLPKQADPSR